MTASPTPPDFFAESANKSEHHAESAYCSDHIVDADKMVSAGLPSEEETARVLIAHFVENTGFQTVNEDDTKTSVAAYYGGHWVDLRIYPIARAILDLIRPAFEAKEREIAEADAEITLTESLLADERAVRFAAEAKLAQAVEAMAPFDDALGEDDEGYGGGLTVVMKWGYCTDYSITLEDLRDLRKAARAAASGEKT